MRLLLRAPPGAKSHEVHGHHTTRRKLTVKYYCSTDIQPTASLLVHRFSCTLAFVSASLCGGITANGYVGTHNISVYKNVSTTANKYKKSFVLECFQSQQRHTIYPCTKCLDYSEQAHLSSCWLPLIASLLSAVLSSHA